MSALRIRSTSSAAVRPAPRVTRSRVVVRAAVTTVRTLGVLEGFASSSEDPSLRPRCRKARESAPPRPRQCVLGSSRSHAGERATPAAGSPHGGSQGAAISNPIPSVPSTECASPPAADAQGMTVAEAIKNAQQVCAEGTVDQCQSAWDAVSCDAA
eukprot:356894-Chlamydomonas_euryale.AAC.11